MPARVPARSRPIPLGFQLLKMDGPKGEFVPGMGANWLLWGRDPARSRDNKVELLLAGFSGAGGSGFGDGVLLNGLCAGVGLEDFGPRPERPRRPFPAPPGENREGTVPARARLVWGMLSGVGSWAKSGKPSVGDSGMFSRRGVEFPLVGGPPQRLTGIPGTPSCAWISRALFIQSTLVKVRGRIRRWRIGGRRTRGTVWVSGVDIPFGEQAAGTSHLVRRRTSPGSRVARHLARSV